VALEIIDMKDGGKCMVILAEGYQLPFQNEQIVSMKPSELSGSKDEISKQIPSDTNVVILSDGIPSFTSQNILAVLRQRGLTYIQRKSQEALTNTLIELFPSNIPAEFEPVKKKAVRGSVMGFVKMHANLDEPSNTAEAKRLSQIAEASGMTISFSSLVQTIGNLKSQKRSAPKKVAKEANKTVIPTINDIILNLETIRDYVASMEKMNVELKVILSSAEAVLKK
jgi:hypothetical protein